VLLLKSRINGLWKLLCPEKFFTRCFFFLEKIRLALCAVIDIVVSPLFTARLK
jgi:hypothetical protein